MFQYQYSYILEITSYQLQGKSMACEQLGRPISVLVSTVAIEIQFRAVTLQQFKGALQHCRDKSYQL